MLRNLCGINRQLGLQRRHKEEQKFLVKPLNLEIWKYFAKISNDASNAYWQAIRRRTEVAFTTGKGSALRRWDGTRGQRRVGCVFPRRQNST